MLRKLTIVLVLAATAAYFFLIAEPEPGGGLVLVDPSAQAETSDIASHEVDVPPHERTRANTTEPGAQLSRVRGRVVRIDGSPVGDVEVVQKHPYLTADAVRSAADGSFALDVEEPRGELSVGDGPWLLLGGERFLAAGHPDGYFLIVAEARTLSGHVTNRDGAPMRGVDVRATAPTDALVPLGIIAMPLFDARQSTITDATGAFRIQAPNLPGAKIEAALVGYQTIELPLAGSATGELALVLVGH